MSTTAGAGAPHDRAPREPERAIEAALLRVTEAIEQNERLDAAASAVRGVAGRLVAVPRVSEILRGAPLGHAAHPLLTDIRSGCGCRRARWTCWHP